MKLEELEVYKIAMELGEKLWNEINVWNYFEKETIGKQLIKSVDSIAANIAEGFGRYHFKENRNFIYYARGSLFESKTWLKKANNRNLIDSEVFQILINEFERLGLKINNYLNSIGKQKSTNDNK